MQVKNSIRWQMVVVICSFIFVSFLLFSTVVRNILIDDYKRLVQNNDKQLLQILSYNIGESMAKPFGLIHLASIYPSLMQLDEQGKINVLNQAVSENDSFEMISIVNAEGTQVTNAMSTTMEPSSLYYELKDSGDTTVSPVHYSQSTKNLVVTFIHKIEEDNVAKGAVVADINIKYIRNLITDYSKNNQVLLYLLDQNGTAIAQPTKLGEGLFNYDTLKKIKYQRDHGGYVIYDENGQPRYEEKNFTVPKGFIDAIHMAKEYGGNGESEYSDDRGEKFFCIYQSVELPFIDTKWSIVLVHASSDMNAMIDNLFIKALVAGFIILIFASFTIIYFSEKMTKPIFQIVEMANRVRAGDLSGQLNIKNDNEIGLLADNINHMIQGLRVTRKKSKEAENQIKAIAYHDTLTGLPNRMHFMIYIRETLEKSVKGRFYGALLFIDVDKFKSINDNYGHAVGDGLLIAFAKRIVDIAGRKEIACRFGGDEFLLFLPGYNDTDTQSVCERLVKTMREPFNISGKEFALSTSIGAALFPRDANDIDELMEKADAALYVSKRNGRNQYNFYAEGMETVPIDERD